MALEIKQLTIKSNIVFDRSTKSNAETERLWQQRKRELIDACMKRVREELRTSVRTR